MRLSTKVRFMAMAAVLVMVPAGARAAGDFATARVVDLPGSQSLQIHAQPSRHAPLVAEIPFNATGLVVEGSSRYRWMLVSFRGVRGYVRAEHISHDNNDGLTLYHAVNLRPGERLDVLNRPSERSRVIGFIPPNATGIEGAGRCLRQFCPVRYSGIDGWVSQNFLAVTRFSAPDALAEPEPRGRYPGYGYGYGYGDRAPGSGGDYAERPPAYGGPYNDRQPGHDRYSQRPQDGEEDDAPPPPAYRNDPLPPNYRAEPPREPAPEPDRRFDPRYRR